MRLVVIGGVAAGTKAASRARRVDPDLEITVYQQEPVVRPTADARVSAPLRWQEVPRSDPSRFTVKTMRKRIDKVGDLTAGMWRRKASLQPRFEKLGLEPPPSG